MDLRDIRYSILDFLAMFWDAFTDGMIFAGVVIGFAVTVLVSISGLRWLWLWLH